MKSQALQDLVREIFSNEEIRSQFMTNPNSVLSRFSLTEDEKKAVLKTNARLGLIASNSNRLEAVIEPTDLWH